MAQLFNIVQIFSNNYYIGVSVVLEQRKLPKRVSGVIIEVSDKLEDIRYMHAAIHTV